MLSVISLHDGSYSANSFVVFDTVSGESALFDPSGSPDEFKVQAEQKGLTLKYLVLTHGHYDHMVTLNEFRAAFPLALTAMSEHDADCLSDPIRSCAVLFSAPEFRSDKPELLISHGDTLTLGNNEINVIATPGHTPGSLCFTFGKNMITGDTLFYGSVGRSDLPGGDTEVLFATLRYLTELDTDYTIYPGHGQNSTIFYEKRHNPFLRGMK